MSGFITMSEEWLNRTGVEYFLQVTGNCMASAGIKHGDFIGVKPQGTANDGDIVVARVRDSGCIVQFLYHYDGQGWLVPADQVHDPIRADDTEILGVVGGVIHWRD